MSRNPDAARIIKLARLTNDEKTNWVIERIETLLDELERRLCRKPKLACLGVTFKPDVEDLRGAPALKIYRHFLDNGVEVLAVDPMLKDHSSVETKPFDEVVSIVDLVVVLVAHSFFSQKSNLELLKNQNVFDFCGLLSKQPI